ncbi:MAG TPA: phosphonate C-P lyase system protein PhnG [Alphaproteobacteria bacterium]
MPDASASRPADPDQRRRWMGVLARARTAELEAAWEALSAPPAYAFLRKPETGLVLVRGRAGGTGAAFNLGEMTMTRCAVRLDDKAGGARATGLAFVAGRDDRHAELAALFDALLQIPRQTEALDSAVIQPIEARLERERRAAAGEVAATRVDFFTLVREQS